MNWAQVFATILQPILFIGLFVMTLISMLIAIRAEKREIERNKRDIVANAKKIKENYKLLKKIALEHHASYQNEE